jgi:excinuclease UvrABC nuclease subunit
VLLKDDEHYPFLHATNGDVPILTIVPRKTNDSGGRFFGPYTNFKEIHTILDGIEETYDLRGQAFLARHGSLPKDSYRELFDKVIEEVFDRVSESSSLSKLREEYQHAGLLFDSEYNRSRDVVAVAQVQHPNRKHKLIVHVVQLREGVVAGQYSYNCELSRIDDQVDDADFAEAIQAVLLNKHYPAGASESQSDRFSWIPESILVPIALSKQSSIEAYLEKPVSIKIAAKSGPRKAVDMRVAEFASQNANQAAAVELKKENDNTSSNDVGKLLDLVQPLRRIECYVRSLMIDETTAAFATP